MEEIASLAANAGVQGCDGPEQESGGTLHPLGFASHVKTCNVLKRSKTYSICGVSMNRRINPDTRGRHAGQGVEK